jgi:hypothetical protein
MTPEEERLAVLLADLGERHRPAAGSGAWLGPRLRRARARRNAAAAVLAAVAVAVVAGTAAVWAGRPDAAPLPVATDPPSAVPSPAPSAATGRAFVSALSIRPTGTGAAVVGRCPVPNEENCPQSVRLTRDAGRTFDLFERPLPKGPDAPDVRAIAAAGASHLYVWGIGGLAYSRDDGMSWTSVANRQVTSVTPVSDEGSVWIATQDCPARGASGCKAALFSSPLGRGPSEWRPLAGPFATAGIETMGRMIVSRAPGAMGAVAVTRTSDDGRLGPDVLWTTDDYGKSWQGRSLPCRGSDEGTGYDTAGVSVTSRGAVWVLCKRMNDDGQGRVWASASLTAPFRETTRPPDRGLATDVSAHDERTAYLSGPGGEVLATDDAGLTWTRVTPVSALAGPVQVLDGGPAVAPGRSGEIWAGTGTARWTARPVEPVPATAAPQSSGAGLNTGRPLKIGRTDEFGIAARLTLIGSKTFVDMDRVDWLTGPDAERAAAEHGQGVDGEYYLVNDSTELRRYVVSPDAAVFGSIMLTGKPEHSRVPLSAWTAFVRDDSRAKDTLFHLHVETGQVVQIEEQYRP